MKKLIILLIVLLSAVWCGSAADAAIIVGRISHVEGNLFRYMDAEKSWVETHLQSPAGIEDVLATGYNSRAEITFPNNLLLRLDENAEVEILELDDDLGVFQLNSGVARLYNRSVSGRLAIETIQGTVKVGPESVIDVQADGNTVLVSAVRGEATFQSMRNDAEILEVISGSTRLELREGSIVAGTGPISSDWDRWCANREGIWVQNRLVRSEYLPESMQEYAYELESYGTWSRVYYRGYYYWAWKPHYVASGWSPYTYGYWYDWHGSPVWIDHNPWGWATHHHGHWIDMHGSWMWTPYIHVSYVPGVAVVGANITFSNTYRPHWHPGRVRWISYNDYIGWFPLAPWEIYYGYRRWDPGTVLVQGGSGFSLSITLSNHRHVKHGVIIPRQYLYKDGPVVVNNYNTVRVRNINKTVIVKNYKPMVTAEKEWTRKGAVGKSAGSRNFDRRQARVQPDKKMVKAGETVRRERPANGYDRKIQKQREPQPERSVKTNSWRGSRQSIAKGLTDATGRANEKNTSARKTSEKIFRPAQRTTERQIEKQEKPLPGSSIAAGVSPQRKPVNRNDRTKARAEQPRQAGIESSGRSKVTEEKPAAPRKRDRAGSTVARKEIRQPQKQAAGNEERAKKASANNNRRYIENEERKEGKTERQISKNEKSSREKNESQGRNRDRQKSGSEWLSASAKNPRLR